MPISNPIIALGDRALVNYIVGKNTNQQSNRIDC